MSKILACMLFAFGVLIFNACADSDFASLGSGKAKSSKTDGDVDETAPADGGQDAGDDDGSDVDLGNDDDGTDTGDLGSDDGDSSEDEGIVTSDGCVANKGLITFETLPDGQAPTDGLKISDQFRESHGITFKLANGKLPQLAKVGPPMTAFQCGGEASCSHNDDGVAEKYKTKLGEFFLTDDGVVAGPGVPSPLVVTYTTPVTKASGNLLDVDGTEVWRIKALDADGNELESVTLTKAEGVNGGPSLWSFEFDEAKIASIVMTGSGKTSGFGLAFDSFSPTAVCKD